MADRAQIFTEVTLRNALRREAKLPLLDVRAEMARMENVDAWREWNALYETHASKRAEIRKRVLLTFLDQGRDMRSGGGHRAVEYLTDQEFHAFLWMLGHRRPDLPQRSVVSYGGA